MSSPDTISNCFAVPSQFQLSPSSSSSIFGKVLSDCSNLTCTISLSLTTTSTSSSPIINQHLKGIPQLQQNKSALHHQSQCLVRASSDPTSNKYHDPSLLSSALLCITSATKTVTSALELVKRVNWADDNGRFLCKEVLFFKDDEPWRCNRRYSTPLLQGLTHKLEKRNLITSSCRQTSDFPSLTPTLEFTDLLPCSQQESVSALNDHAVHLESIMLRSPLVFCTIKVSNICYQKKVFVRVSSNNWQTYTDIEASYLQGSSDGLSERFYATIGMPNYSFCKTLQFAVCFDGNGVQHWDNNSGKNYEIRLLLPPVTSKI